LGITPFNHKLSIYVESLRAKTKRSLSKKIKIKKLIEIQHVLASVYNFCCIWYLQANAKREGKKKEKKKLWSISSITS